MCVCTYICVSTPGAGLEKRRGRGAPLHYQQAVMFREGASFTRRARTIIIIIIITISIIITIIIITIIIIVINYIISSLLSSLGKAFGRSAEQLPMETTKATPGQ